MGGLRNWKKIRALVTGASGFIGEYLVRRLRDLGAEVYPATAPGGAGGPSYRGSSFDSSMLVFDVRDRESVKAAVDEVDPNVVFHLAAVGVTGPVADPMQVLMVNAGGVVNLLEALRGRDVRRVVLTGTSHEYGAQEAEEGLDPFSAYAASKVAAWAYGRMYWRVHSLPIVTVRPFQVYGPGQPHGTLIPAAVSAALRGSDFAMSPGQQERDFVHVNDVVTGMTAVAEAPGVEGKSLDLGSGIGHPIRQVVDQIWRLTGAKGEVQPGALLYRPGEPMRLVADADRTTALTGWRALTPLEEGLARTIRSVRREGIFHDA